MVAENKGLLGAESSTVLYMTLRGPMPSSAARLLEESGWICKAKPLGSSWLRCLRLSKLTDQKGFYFDAKKHSHKKKYEDILKHGYKFISQVELCSYSAIAIKGDRTTIGLEHCRSGPLGG